MVISRMWWIKRLFIHSVNSDCMVFMNPIPLALKIQCRMRQVALAVLEPVVRRVKNNKHVILLASGNTMEEK